jgi:hypothetical protein
MALTTSEIQRIKAELGFNLLNAGADVYVGGITAFFENVLQVYAQSGASTTCTTVIPTPTQLPTAVAITLASSSGFASGLQVLIDVDGLQEAVTIQSISGSVITVLLAKPHQGTYPVTIPSTGTVTSSTTVVPALPSPPTLASLTLASAVGFSANDTIIVDDGVRQESTKAISVIGNVVTCMLLKGHAGTYAVTVEGGESIIRSILQILQTLSPLGGNAGSLGGNLGGAADGAGIKKVDEIEFFGATSFAGTGASFAGNTLQQTLALIEYWRDQLASVIGIRRRNKKCGGTLSQY